MKLKTLILAILFSLFLTILFLGLNLFALKLDRSDKYQFQNYFLNLSDRIEKEILNINSNLRINYMKGIATAYHPSSGGINCDSNPEITSTGVPAKVGVIAVNPKVIPYRSTVIIVSWPYIIKGIANDTGGAMRQNPKQVDILKGTLKEALDWGVREAHIIWYKKEMVIND